MARTKGYIMQLQVNKRLIYTNICQEQQTICKKRKHLELQSGLKALTFEN